MSSVVDRPASPDEHRENATLRVSCVGIEHSWLGLDGAQGELEDVLIEHADALAAGPERHVLHVGRGQLARAGALNGELGDAMLVVDLTGEGEGRLSRREARAAETADVILLGSLAELRDFRAHEPKLATRSALLARPLDLERYAPLPALRERRDAQIKRFRRFHRLAGPFVLFGGPYTEAGGLDLALEAVYRLREHTPELRLAAVPHGAIDQGFLDQCERRALALGHHGIIEWAPADDEFPLWYALASVVCAPTRMASGAMPPRLAAAAGRTFVGSDVTDVAEHIIDGETGFLVKAGDLDALTAALEAVLGDPDEATRTGEAARRRAEDELSPAAAARRLRQVWLEGWPGGARGERRIRRG